MDLNDWRARLREVFGPLIERDHVVVLNWGPPAVEVVRALITGRGKPPPLIVVMAAMEKAAIEDEIARRAGDLHGVRIEVRPGDPTDPYDLTQTNPQTARAVVIVSPPGANPDSQVTKTVLALVNDPKRGTGRMRIAAELREAANADLIRAVGGSEVELVLSDEVVARALAQSTRQPGLPAALTSLLAAHGLHAVEQPELSGNAFGDALMAYETASLIGIADQSGRVMLNPPPETMLQDGMRMVVIADDAASVIIAAERISVDTGAISLLRPAPKSAERVLMLGWNRRAPIVLRELSLYVAPGSVATIAATRGDLLEQVGKVVLGAPNLGLECAAIDPTRRDALEGLGVARYDHVVVLAESDDGPQQAADTRTLMSLLHLRRMAESGDTHLNVVAEMSDAKNRELAEVTRADEFVVSNALIGLMLARTGANNLVPAIFEDLLDEQGSELYLRPANHYVESGRPVSFYTIVEAARRRGEIAIGHLRDGEVTLNPTKTTAVSYSPGDRIVVVAKD